MRLILPKQVIIEKDALEYLRVECKAFGKRAVVITTKGAWRYGLEKLKKVLDNFEIHIFDKVYPEPDYILVDEARSFIKDKKIDFVIGFGGGSAIDTAKALCALANESLSTDDFLQGKQIQNKILPFVAVPTIYGACAEVTSNAVIKDKQQVKKSIRVANATATVVIYDLSLPYNIDKKQLLISTIDGLIHGTEAFVSNNSNKITDFFAKTSANLFFSFLKKIEDYNEISINDRENLAKASCFGGIALTNAGLGAIHGLAAPIGGLTNVQHGLVCAILSKGVINLNQKLGVKKYEKIEEIVEYLKDIEKILKKFSLPYRLSQLGLKEEKIEFVIKNVSTSGRYNPVILSDFDYKQIINEVF